MDIQPESIFENPPERLRTFWIYFQKADDNDTKEIVLEALSKAMTKTPKPINAGTP